LDLQKAWHGLHYLLTGHIWETGARLGFLVSGGRAIGEADSFWRPVRLFNPDGVVALADALSTVSDEILWSRFHAQRMNELGVYPAIWDETEHNLREECLGYFHDVKSFVSKAACDGAALIVQTPNLGGIDEVV